ncbi:MAG: rod shape-determining protein MreC [Endomicrobium sp.]|jgi:rod shape-determining protein MreC|nr:rod shape-determining protein MreC [Endomicrobium sp.]
MHKYYRIKLEKVVFVILISISLYFIVGRFSDSVKFIKNIVYEFIYQNLSVTDRIFYLTKNIFASIKNISRLQQENLLYKQKNQELINKLYNYDLLFQEYSDLSKLLNLKKNKKTLLVFSKILIREPSEWYKWIIIDKGFNDGLYNELPVVMFDKYNSILCVLGKIIETYKNSSKIILITNSTYKLPVEINGIKCLANGINSNLLRINYIPVNENIKHGDKVIVSNLSSIFQKGLYVGVIKTVRISNKTSEFKIADAEICFENNTICNNVAIVLLPQVK